MGGKEGTTTVFVVAAAVVSFELGGCLLEMTWLL
jgi:hypothetical protein